jgi:hypothetical protein
MLPVYNQFTKHLMILVSHCPNAITYDLSSLKVLEVRKDARFARGVARTLLSMLPHVQYEIYRQDVMRRERRLAEETNKEVPDPEEVEQRFIDMKNTHDVSSPRSLQALCRLRLYELTPANKKLPLVVLKLEISDVLQRFLSLESLSVYTFK